MENIKDFNSFNEKKNWIKDAISNKPFFYRDLNSQPSMSEIENITGTIVNKLFNINKNSFCH